MFPERCFFVCEMKTILGIKKGMTQVFDEKGNPIPVTVISAGPVFVTQVKTKEKDGYSAVQLGFGEKKKISKPLAGHLKGKNFRYLREAPLENGEEIAPGAKFTVDMFQVGDLVKVTGTSKGLGFAGVIKRHGFSRAPVSHGHPFSRKPGSIGSMFPERVLKGMRMAGRAGNKRVTIRNLKVAQVDSARNLLMIKGGVPGAINSLVMITKMND